MLQQYSLFPDYFNKPITTAKMLLKKKEGSKLNVLAIHCHCSRIRLGIPPSYLNSFSFSSYKKCITFMFKIW